METNYIFVYGVLKSMYDNEHARIIRSNCDFIGEASFKGVLLDLGSYPGALYDKTSSRSVFGEVFQIKKNKEELVTLLDKFEGVGKQFEFPNEYKREFILVQISGERLLASCYLYNLDWKDKKVIESGRYENEYAKRDSI